MVSSAPRGRPAPAGSPPAKKPTDSKTVKTVLFGIAAAVLVVGFFMYIFTGQDKKDYLERRAREVTQMQEDRATPPPPRREEAPVELAPRPVRLFHDFIPAIITRDKTAVLKLSQLSTSEIDQLLTQERSEMVAAAWPMRRFKMLEEKVDPETARMVVSFQNPRGLDTEALALDMKKQGGPEDWKITKVSTRYGDGSGKTVEDKFVVLGGDRSKAAAPPRPAEGPRQMPEAEPGPVDWLADTPETLKTEIEKNMRDLMDAEHPALLSTASARLAEIGKPAIPRLLTELAKLDIRKEEGARNGNAIDRTLTAMTDMETGYNPSEVGLGAGGVPPAMARTRAIKRWFGWWQNHKDKPLVKRRVEDTPVDKD